MDKENIEEVLLRVWMRLEEVKKLLAVIEKGLKAEIQTDASEMHSVVCVVKRQLEGVIGIIDLNV